MKRMIVAIAVGLTFGIASFLPSSFHTGPCDHYVQKRYNDQLDTPYGMVACDDFGTIDISEFALVLIYVGILCLGIVLAIRIAGRAHIALAVGIAATSFVVAELAGMYLSRLPMSLLLKDSSWYGSMLMAAAIGLAVGMAERRRAA